MRDLPLPLALTARLLPVVVLASAGWALTSGPLAATPTGESEASGKKADASASPTTPSTQTAVKAYRSPPAPCDSIAVATVGALVPGAKKSGQEIASTDKSVRRTCSWNALKGYEYRWLDVSFEIKKSDEDAANAFAQRTKEKGGGGEVPGLGQAGYSVVNLTTDDKQQTREGMVVARAANALVIITYNGSDFETKKAPGTDEINKGAIKAAKEAVAALEESR